MKTALKEANLDRFVRNADPTPITNMVQSSIGKVKLTTDYVVIPSIIFYIKNYIFIIKTINFFRDKLLFDLTQNQFNVKGIFRKPIYFEN